MARLLPDDPNELAIGGSAKFTVELGGSPSVELWERVLPCAPGAAAPPFSPRGVFTADTALSHPVPLGDVYQVRMFRENQGNSTGTGDLLGKLDFPCVLDEARSDFLTRCAETPQIDIVPGGTYVSFAYAGSTPTCCRVQLGVKPPQAQNLDLPFFLPEEVVASSVVNEPKFLNRVSVVDELRQPDTDGHPLMETGQELFFVLFAWNDQGSWDMVWSTKGIAPANPPESFFTLMRVVDVSLTRLLCLDDSDDLSAGEADFTFIVQHAGGELRRTLTWDPMDTGKERKFPIGSIGFQINHPDSAGRVAVRVEGLEDDSGSFPPDDDDPAAFPLTGFVPLQFPVGEGKEDVSSSRITGRSKPLTASNSFEFDADIVYSVEYV